jgi:hypothetical protein
LLPTVSEAVPAAREMPRAPLPVMLLIVTIRVLPVLLYCRRSRAAYVGG